MARVLTFSQKYPKVHPKEGQPTFFVEKVLNTLGIDWESFKYLDMLDNLNPHIEPEAIDTFFVGLGLEYRVKDSHKEKLHTIRANNPKTGLPRFKEGDMFSPRVWSGKPYASPQITFAPDQEVVRTYSFKIREYAHGFAYMDIGENHQLEQFDFERSILPLVARNDGLTMEDLLKWFKWPKPFDGQIIAWKDPKY